jgi:hypothetical protein
MSDPFLMTKELDGFLFGVSNVMHPSRRRSLRAHYFEFRDMGADDVAGIIKNLYAENGLVYDSIEVSECYYEDYKSLLDAAVRQDQETIKEEVVDNLTKHILFRIGDFIREIFDENFRFTGASYSRYIACCGDKGLKDEFISVRKDCRLLVLHL